MNLSDRSVFMDDRREFNLILTGSFVFYLGLILLFYFTPVELVRSNARLHPAPRTITLLNTPSRPVPKPLPQPPAAVQPVKKKTAVPIQPKKALKSPPKMPDKAPVPKPPAPPEPTAEEIERRKAESLALQRAKELEKNREIAKSKLSSLFGTSMNDVTQNSRLNVIATPKSAGNRSNRAVPAVPSGDDLQIQIQNPDTDSILKGLPSSREKKGGALFGEHETKRFGSSTETGKLESVRSPEDFEKSFKAYEGRLKSFYDKTLQAKPALNGSMTVKITVAADGTVSRCEILSSSLNDKTFEEEIRRMIQDQFRFSRIAQGEEYYNKSLNFRPEK
jgi:protein TonB